MKYILSCFILTLELSTHSFAKRYSRHHLTRHSSTTTTINTTPTPSSSSTPSNKLINSAEETAQGGCEGWWCGPGTECELNPNDGLPGCRCLSKCEQGIGSTVCGTDGRIYQSHCELHRNACLSKSSLTIDHSKACFKQQQQQQQNRKTNWNKLETKRRIKTKGNFNFKRANSFNNKNINSNSDFKPSDFSDYYPTGIGARQQETKTNEPHQPQPQLPSSMQSGGGLDWSFPISEKELGKGKRIGKGGKNGVSLQDSLEEGDDDDEEEDTDESLEEDEEDMEEESDSEEEGEELMVSPAEGPNSLASVLNPSKMEEIKKASSSLCSPQEYEILKDNLLLYNHERMIGGVRNFKAAMEGRGNAPTDNKLSLAGDGPEAGKDYLLSLMFSHFDRNNNGALEYDELHKVDLDESLSKLASGCSLVHLLRFDDFDHNGQLNINEFYTAFNKLYSVSVISLDKALETTHVTATVGDNVELKCDVSGSPPMPIVWTRYNVDLSGLNQEEQIRVFPDGSLYLNRIQLLHSGNYTCHAQRNQEVIQTHILSVQTLPDVKVMPHIVWEKPGAEISMECRVMGEPFPVVQWLKNDDPLPLEMSHKYSLTGDGIRLTLKDVYFSDTGAYMCKAQNSAGKKLDISSLVVIDASTPPTVQTNESQFFVFHDHGISIYDPTNCRIQHQISGTDIIPGTQQEYLCGSDQSSTCDWGRAIRVSNTYVYASQPKLDRILVISTSQMVVVDVVPTDRYPVELAYIPHLDQVWVQAWRSSAEDEKIPPKAQKTLQVIREGREKRKHHTVHPEPIDSHFDLVEDLFVPPDCKSSSQFRYGYVSHRNGRGLYKMDLVALRYIKSVDLTPYNCVPKHLQYSALYGMIIVECFEPVTNKPTGQLVLDSLTDSVIYFKGDRFGRPYLSPDSRKLVTVSHSSDGSTTLLLQLIRENGLEFSFDVKTSLNISDVTFFPSQRSHTYDLYASSVDKDDVLFLDLESGKVEMVSGVGSTLLGSSSWKSPFRSISSQGLFSKYLATPSDDSVYILNGHSHTINCQIGGLPKPHLLVWL